MTRLDLRKLILLLAVVSAVLAFLNSLLASYHTQRQQLMLQTLDANQAYAAKLADIAQGMFISLEDQLAVSAAVLGEHFDTPTMDSEVGRLIMQSAMFNSIMVVSADGTVLSSTQDSRSLVGSRLSSPAVEETLNAKTPQISAPYRESVGEMAVLVSHPIFDANDHYLGYVGGYIYLQQTNTLHALMDLHYQEHGFYLYAVDLHGRLIFHEDHDRVGEDVSANPVVQAVLRNEEGSQEVVNSRGVTMLAGYAPVPAAGWGIVAQRPTEETLKAVDQLAWLSLRNAIPFSVVTLALIWWLALWISRPLRQLANTARDLDAANALERIRAVRGWYYEADRLQNALLTGVALMQQKLGKLNQETITDPLTGLFNRRGMNASLDLWGAHRQTFAALAVDVDHFKRINDSYGHDVGDAVLQFLAQEMRRCARSSDLVCRNGGEEFLMLLPNVAEAEAMRIAQRLCDHIAATASPTGQPITVSIGVSHYPAQSESITEVLKLADKALYAAKHGGRNQVIGASEQAA